ncbi:unnamed protein product [Cuscuta epithymum]|uniref:RNase H type-1 domain-containing protein n=1 Tax=Cuscuta epithymum TaxID=186058 RepID=A0AAV0FN94_9ASTE|nr:unnamed protein product [Cuscuta epithymum]
MCWKNPAPGRLKLNVDAAIRENRSVLGWILRDDSVNFIAGMSKVWIGVLSPLVAELIGIREALSWAKGRGWDRVDVESDSSGAISEILKESSISLVGVLDGDIREIASCFMDISFFHVKRSANRASHELAKAACSVFDCICMSVFPPHFITHVLNTNSLNAS